MNLPWQRVIWQQCGAAIDMLDNALLACPDELWAGNLWVTPGDPSGFSEFWYLAYHTLFWLDYNLSGAADDFAPPPPFTLAELDPAGLLPDRIYTKTELRSYLQNCRQKCHDTVNALTDESAARACHFNNREMSFFELLLYNMRHVQDHAAQMNLFLGQKGIPVISWVGKAKEAAA